MNPLRLLLTLTLTTHLSTTALAKEKKPAQQLLQRYIPSAQNPQGEIRLIAQDTQRHLQILLYTPNLGRALRQMRKSENKNWPPKSIWHPSSQHYLKSLDAFRQHLRKQETTKQPHIHNLLIEFHTSDKTPATIQLSQVHYTGQPHALQISNPTPFATLTPPGTYVASNQLLIVRETFNLSHQQTQQLLQNKTSIPRNLHPKNPPSTGTPSP